MKKVNSDLRKKNIGIGLWIVVSALMIYNIFTWYNLYCSLQVQ